MKLDVVYTKPRSPGWFPVEYMAQLAAAVLEGRLTVVEPARPSRTRQCAALVRGRRKAARSQDRLLLICPSGHHLKTLFQLDAWRTNYSRVVAWVFDTFWVESIPRLASRYQLDHLFVTELECIDSWRRAMKVPTDWAPWGSDVLGLGSRRSRRAVDVQRLGRQPAGWDDDGATEEACSGAGLTFRGRPRFGQSCSENQRLVMAAFSNARFSLSFSNSVSPGVQTHPSLEYITGRWTDALAAGATVAGVPPRSQSVERLFWPGALLDLGTVDPDEGLRVLKSECSRWEPARAHENYRQALKLLDWRWRFRDIAGALGIAPPTLRAQLNQVRASSSTRSAASYWSERATSEQGPSGQ